MKKWKTGLIFGIMAVMLLGGCVSKTAEPEEERTETDFTVAEQEEIPEKLLEIIEENKKEEIRLAYEDGQYLYLVRGYGEQETGGCSITVAECTEDEKHIWLHTRLLGPEHREQLSQEYSCPYLVIKMEKKDKEVMID